MVWTCHVCVCTCISMYILIILHSECTICISNYKILHHWLLQLSVNSGRALEILLEKHKLFSLLLSNIKLQGLAQLKTKLQSAEPATTASKRDDPLPTESRHSSSAVNNSDSHLREDNSTPQLQLHTTYQHEGVTAACIECCNPYVISGWCLLVNNLLQTFPDLIGAYVHNYCIVASLTRWGVY